MLLLLLLSLLPRHHAQCENDVRATPRYHTVRRTTQAYRSNFSDIFVDSVHIELSLWDTAGQEEFDRLRSLSYDNTDVVVLCFSVDSKDSLENVESKWVGEIQENCPGVKLV